MATTTPSVHYDDNLHKALVASKLAYMKPVQKLVSFDADQSIASAFESLHLHQIQSAPVFDKNRNAWIGIIDLKVRHTRLGWIPSFLAHQPSGLCRIHPRA